MNNVSPKQPMAPWRRKMHEIIFGAETPGGKLFDVMLIASILISVAAVMFDSVKSVKAEYGLILYGLEWFFTILFTIEYLMRLICVGSPLRYATSFFGIIDLLAVIPTYLSLILPGTHYFLVIRIIRVLRIFRVLKLVQYISEANLLLRAFKASSRKITVFLFAVLSLVIIFGSLIYVIEGERHGFTSIPRSIYWAIVTMTTVGYGDISPKTSLGQTVAALVMIIGYSIIAVPTGIVTVEINRQITKDISNHPCPECGASNHEHDAVFCRYCGTRLAPPAAGKT